MVEDSEELLLKLIRYLRTAYHLPTPPSEVPQDTSRRPNRGENHYAQKLSDEIVEKLKAGAVVPSVGLARELGVWPSYLYRLAKGKYRKDVPGTAPSRPKRLSLGGAKVTESMVQEIRTAVGTNAEVGKKFGLSSVAVSRIRNRKTWAHVIDEVSPSKEGLSFCLCGLSTE